MRSRSVAVAIVVTVLSAGGAVGCFVKAQKLRSDVQWLLERGAAEGAEYADTFDDAAANKQIETLQQRRAVFDQAALWQRAQLLLILVSVVSAFASYVLYLFAKLRASIDEADEALPLDERVRKEVSVVAHAHAR